MEEWKTRLREEYTQLNERYDKLTAFIIKYEKNKLGFTPKTPLSMLEEQLYYMGSYKRILEQRMKIEGIKDV